MELRIMERLHRASWKAILAKAIYWLGILYLMSLFLIIVAPQVYTAIRGHAITKEVMSQIGMNTTNPNELALRIYSWEQQKFTNLYFVRLKDMSWSEKILAIHGIYYDKQGKPHLFRPFRRFQVPPQWVLHTKLANCGEYAEVFVYLMNEAGFKARIVRAPGEDHSWAEYYVGNYKIIFDPSNPKNPVIVNPKQFGKLKNFSYVEAYDLTNPNHREDVSDEYIERGTLVVEVVKANEPVPGATVEVLSTYLMERFPERYDKPRRVVFNETGKNGTAQFKLGPKEYEIVGRKCSFPLCWKGETTGSVITGSTAYVKLELGIDYLATGILWGLTIMLAGIIAFVIHKGYLFWSRIRNGGHR